MSALLYFALNPPKSTSSRTGSSDIKCTSYHTRFLVIENSLGYNDSVDHGVPQSYWPILCVHEGDTVQLTVENTGSEPHGFVIAHYYEQGISLTEGQRANITFVAGKAGSFIIYCDIFCSVHQWMLSGILVVT